MYVQNTDALSAIVENLNAGPAEIRFDGRFHHFRIDNSRDAGWYIARLTPTGEVVHYGDWRQPDIKYVWTPGKDVQPPSMQQILERERQNQERLQRSLEQADQAAATAWHIWDAAPPAETHPYLESKGVPPFFARLLTADAIAAAPKWIQGWISRNDLAGSLIIPIGRAGQLVSLQFICADGTKKLLPHGQTKAGRCFIGKPEGAEVIAVAEGFATAASVHLATGYPVAVAFTAGNINDVVAGLRRNHPDALIIIAADNDLRSSGAKAGNTGVDAARSAVLRFGNKIKVAIPELNNKKCDWNDVFLAKGADTVRSAIQALLQPEEPVQPTDTAVSATAASIKLQETIDQFFDAAGTADQHDVCIRGAAGLGKSTVTAATANQRQTCIDVFVPSYKVAQEQAQRLPDGVAIAIRGRTHQTPDSPPLCAKHEAATLLAKSGLANMTMPLLCGKVDPKTGKRPCPYARQCPYLQQFQNQAPIHYLAHEWLPLPESSLSKNSNRTPVAAVIDESFRDSVEDYRSWNIAEFHNQTDPIYLKLAIAIKENRLLEDMKDCIPEIDAILDQYEVSISVHPEMDAVAAAKVLQPFSQAYRPPINFLRRCKEAIETGAVNALHYSGKGAEGFIHSARVKPIQYLRDGIPKLFLDASAADCIIKRISPDCETQDIAVKRNVEIIQITDSAMSYHRLREDNAHLSSRMIELAYRLTSEGGKGALIAPKDWIDKHGHRLPTGLETGHYGALRGVNRFEHCDWLIQVGRFEPPPYAVERAVRAWFPQDPLSGGAMSEMTELRNHQGYGARVRRTTHADPRCVELLQSTREQESLQALDRLRLVHHTGQPKRIYLLSNLPLPGATPDRLTTLDELTLPGRLAEVMIRDGALILNRRYLAGKHPDLFQTAAVANVAVEEWRDALNVRFSYIDTNRKTLHSSMAGNGDPALVVIDYRTVKQVGGKNRQAIVYGNIDDPAEVLTRLHGEQIRMVGMKPLYPDASAPAPVIEAPPIPVLAAVQREEVLPVNEETQQVILATAPPIVLNEEPLRFAVWRVLLTDGSTVTLRDPEEPTRQEALALAQRMMTGAVSVEALC